MSRSFDGTDDIINCGTGASLSNLTSFSLCVWTNPRSEGEGSLGRFYEKRTSAGGQGHTVLMQGIAVNQGVECSRNANTGIVSRITATDFLTLNVWQFICVTWDGGNTGATSIKIYRDLVEASYSGSTNGSGGFPDDATGAFCIGNRPNDTNRTYDGKHAFFQFFNRVVTLGEQAMCMLRPGSVRNGLVAFHPLWGGSPEPDYSGNGNHGTVTNGVTLSSDNPPINGIFHPPTPNLYYSSFSTGAAPTSGTGKINRVMLMGIS